MNKHVMHAAAGVLAAALFLPCHVQALSAQSAIVTDAQTGRVLLERRADEKSLIASTTKIMTARVVCEQCNVLDRVRIPRQAVGIEGSSMYLREGEILTVQDLLYGLMLQSGNDAAAALAIYCGGTVEGFVELMNDKARMLGLSGTHFANPSGLDHPAHYSTARDLAALTACAMNNPIFAQTVSTRTVHIGDRYLTNHNKLLWRAEGVDGVKTGYTRAAGRILVSSAHRQGRRLIAVTIDDPDDWNDHKQMLEQGFEQFQLQQIVARGTQIGTFSVAGSAGQSVPLLAGADFYYPLTAQEQLSVVIPGPGFVYAPVVQGTQAGFAHICLDGRSVGKIALLYGATVEMEPSQSFWKKFLGGIRS